MAEDQIKQIQAHIRNINKQFEKANKLVDIRYYPDCKHLFNFRRREAVGKIPYVFYQTRSTKEAATKASELLKGE